MSAPKLQPIDHERISTEEWRLRVDLAAAFRLAAQFDWHESVGNHFSAALSTDGRSFLLNPRWKHFAKVRASDLLRLDFDDEQSMQREAAPDASAWCIHGNVHAAQPRVRVLLHCHPPYATALAGLADPRLRPIDQNTARFFERVHVDLGFDGVADEDEEGRRIATCFERHDVVMMGNHGISTAAATVAEAFEALYFFERAAKTMVLAYSTGQPLNVMSDNLAAKTASGWDAYGDMAFAHFAQLKEMLDDSEPDYAE